jgi:CheY-like chemotaxis protein
VPRVYTADEELAPAEIPAADPQRLPVLIVEDAPEDQLLYEKYLKGSEFQAIPARSLDEARQALTRFAPRAIVLDILLGGQDSWGFLAAAKSDADLRQVPIIVATTVEDQAKGFALGADAYGVKPVARAWLLRELRHRVLGPAARRRALVIDDDEIVRYLVRQRLAHFEIAEATTGEDGLDQARRAPPDLIILDLVMPGMPGSDVLMRLAADAATREIPVVVLTATELDDLERRGLEARAAAVVSKATLASAEHDSGLTETLARLGLV